jgi:hypothetical protein
MFAVAEADGARVLLGGAPDRSVGSPRAGPGDARRAGGDTCGGLPLDRVERDHDLSAGGGGEKKDGEGDEGEAKLESGVEHRFTSSRRGS